MDSSYHHHPNPYPHAPPPPDPRATFPPPPPPGTWYPHHHHHHPAAQQFQFPHHQHPSHSPPPPPPGHPHPHWAPPPHHQQQQQPPPPPPPHHYGIHPPTAFHPPHHQNHYPPPPLPFLQTPPQAYPNHPPQEWGNWVHHPSWDYQAGRNEEDWASRAKAWAASRAATESQHQQSQFGTMGTLEESSPYPGQTPVAAESQYQDIQQQTGPMPGYQNYPVQGTEMNQYYSYPAQDGNLSAEAGSSFTSRQQLTGSSSHQQEVPFSYPSLQGNEDVAHGQHSFRLPSPALHGSVPTDPAQFTHTNQSVDPMIDPHDWPLEFTPRISLDNKPKMPSTYESAGTERGKDSIAALPSLHPWTSSGGPGVSFPSVPPTFPSASQFGISSLGISSIPIQPPQMLGPSPSFPAAISSIGTGVGPTAAILPGDAYGVPIGSDRPKKAAVPNWLREEIIKKAASVGSGSSHPTEESQSLEDDTIDKSVGKGDQADSKSMDSSRLTEEEDEEEEDDVEAARTASINQEIKRVLTEVLLKVTDELLDDIATRVLNEDDIPVAVTAGNYGSTATIDKLSPSPELPAPKASTTVVIPLKARESDAENASEKTGSRVTGNVLGLANYASDEEEEDEDDEENQSSNKLVPSNTSLHITTTNDEKAENIRDAVANGHSNADSEEFKKSVPDHVVGVNSNTSSARVSENLGALAVSLGYNGLLHNEDNGDITPPDVAVLTRKDDVCLDEGKDADSSIASNSKTDVKNLSGSNSGYHEIDDARKSTREDSDVKEEMSLHPGDSSEDTRGTKVKEKIKRDSDRGRQDEKQQKKDKFEDKHDSKGRSREEDRHGRKTREADSRECSPRQGVRGGRKESERDGKVSDKHDADRKRQQGKDEAAERSRDMVKHKTRRSPSVGSRSRNGKDRSFVRNHGDSSDEASVEARRKRHSKRKTHSPSPSRSRKRQISQSPKRSQRRHSPYSSLETSRGRRSRSRSPVRWRR